MLRGSILTLTLLVALAGCSGGGIGDACSSNNDCNGTLQCLNSYCVPQCHRAPECGDGYACDDDGFCQPATGQDGDRCQSEVDCAAGLSCQIDGAEPDSDGHLRVVASCTAENSSRPAGAACNVNLDCRNGTCALGHCVDLCRETLDCAAGTSCMLLPNDSPNNPLFGGCLPSKGAVTWSIPVVSPTAQLPLPVPDAARSAELVMSVDDQSQKVGASSVLTPQGRRIYSLPCKPLLSDPPCAEFFLTQVRHLPAFGQSVLAMPSGEPAALETGMYQIEISSFRSDDTPGSAVPHVTAVVQLDSSAILDLHFFFLDLADHPCAAMTNLAPLDANAARTQAFFQQAYLGELHAMTTRAGLSLGAVTYDDIKDHPELDGLDVANAGALFALGTFATGINVFFVRSLSPIGLQAFGPIPGPAGLGGTRQSGIVIGLDTLCYRGWEAVARLTAHTIAHYMGLYHNVELETVENVPNCCFDPIGDSDTSSNNLMFFSERADPAGGPALGLGAELSPGQRTVLRRSAVLR